MTDGIRGDIEHHEQSLALGHCRRHTLRQSFVVLVTDGKLIDHHLNVVVLIAVQLHPVHHFAHLSVNPYVEVAFLPHLLEQLLVVSLPGTYQRG